tara:strand:+ start:861 stop:1259 length:399 start_codon:yes stop_codon:yes gene_type:complete
MSNSIEAAHHESAKDEKIIFILDMEVIEGKEKSVDSLISRLVKNVKSTEPGTIIYQYFKSVDNKISLYEVYNNNEDALYHVTSFLNGKLRSEFESTFLVKSFQVLGNSSEKLKEAMTVYTEDHRFISNGFKR